jgi:hypothetical protein
MYRQAKKAYLGGRNGKLFVEYILHDTSNIPLLSGYRIKRG